MQGRVGLPADCLAAFLVSSFDELLCTSSTTQHQSDRRTALSPQPTLKILHVDHISADLLLVSYSDKTTAVYTVAQLLSLTPVQVSVQENDGDSTPQNGNGAKH